MINTDQDLSRARFLYHGGGITRYEIGFIGILLALGCGIGSIVCSIWGA